MPSELSPDVNKPALSTVTLTPQQRLQRKFGENFPLLNSNEGKDWRLWIEAQRKRQEAIMRDKRLHWSRHRHFRNGHQWISTRDGRLWREPQADVNDVRAVLNVIGPALDFRLGILSEQRPGFRHEPIGGGVAGRESAEAQQAVTEYYFHMLRAWNIFLDAWYHAQTDGVSFVHVYVDQSAGPTREDIDLIPPTDERYMGLQAQGYVVRPDGLLELPYADEGVAAPPDVPPRLLYEGEIACRILLAHEVLFDPEARSINGPVDRARWALVRRMRDVSQARLETGNDKIESEVALTSQSDVLDMPIDRSMGWQRGLPPFPTRRQRVQDGVPEYLLWIAPDNNEPGLDAGKWMRIIGNEIVEQGDELPGGVIPLARFTDGSADTDIFPRPVMSDWIGDQVAINALLSTLLKHARWFAGGRMLALKNTMLEETYSSIVGSVVEYQGSKPDVFPPVAAGADAWRLLDWLIKKLEDKHGWNDVARGQLGGSSGASSQDISGRAVLATRELFERAFGPVVRAGAEGATEWSHLIVQYAKWLFVEPRLIPAAGGRGDLAKRISSEHLGDRPVVYVDPETLMPLPRALRQQLLEEQLDKGHITLVEYQKRSVYADVRNINMGDSDQWQRAQWLNTMIEEQWEQIESLPPMERYSPSVMPILWQDLQRVVPQPQEGAVQMASQVPAQYAATAHKSALLEIILNERHPWGMRQIAVERWGIYDQLERAANDPMGVTLIPAEVIGVPVDMMMRVAPPLMPPGAMPPPVQSGVPAEEPGGMSSTQQPAAGPSVSPSPVSSPMMTAAGQLPRPQLTEADMQA